MNHGSMIGKEAPGFTLRDSSERHVSLGDFRGKKVVLYFYPKDNTPGCTLEAMDFSALKEEFGEAGAVVLGVSRDTCESHQKFIDSKGLTIMLLSDPDAKVQKLYGVWKPKKFMGREFLGTVRSTFLIDGKGIVRHAWDPVKVRGHAKEVLGKVRSLSG